MPAAAAVPDRNAVGSDQNVTTHASWPQVTSVNAIIEGIGACPTVASISSPTIDMHSPPAECQRRSPVLSE